VGRCRWRRMRSITAASSISAISRKRPPSFDRAQDGPEPRRRSTRLTATLRFSKGRRATARTKGGRDTESSAGRPSRLARDRRPRCRNERAEARTIVHRIPVGTANRWSSMGTLNSTLSVLN
jgi:hypothetical protein